jgi:NADH dehydrogenase
VPALAGVHTVISAIHGFVGVGRVTPESVDRDGNASLIAAARAAGADVVLISVVGASPSHSMELHRMKAAAEVNLRSSGVPWTIVRATAFLELYVDLLRSSAGRTGRPLVFGHGDNPINFVSVTDVADVVVDATLDPSQRGQVLDVCGPRNLSLNELAAVVQRELGTVHKSPRHIPRPALRVLAATRPAVNSALSRQAAAALIMDTSDMTVPLPTSAEQGPDLAGRAASGPSTR